MKKYLLGVLFAVVLELVLIGGVVTSGIIDIGADTPHSKVVYQFLSFAREQSIANKIASIEAPENFGTADRVRRGAGNYNAMCVNCHLSPEAPDSEIRKGLYPVPPNLSAKLDSARDPVRDFWIIKHGIKASGMPAWSLGGMDDDAIWDLVAFVRKLSSLSPKQYSDFVRLSDGHSHTGVSLDHSHSH